MNRSSSFNEEEELKEEATYVINFGKSIKDFTEGNELPNFTFVFSTGAYIDSLSINGSIKDAKTGEPKEDALVLLYTEDIDSIIYQERPFYFARSDEMGKFVINNLRADTFKIMALLDANLNYLYDPGAEEIGFLDSLIVLRDTLSPTIDLEIFKESDAPRYKSYDVQAQGKIRIDFEGQGDTDAIRLLDSVEHYLVHEKEDAYITLWYTPRGRKSLRYEVMRNGELDTVQARINTRSTDTLYGPIDVARLDFDEKVGLHPEVTLDILMDRPIRDTDPALITIIDTLTKDTLELTHDQNSYPALKMSIDCTWPVERELALTLLPGAITDHFDKINDTIIRYLFVAQPADFGIIELTIEAVDSIPYVIQLMKDEELIDSYVYTLGQDKVIFERLVPGTYVVQIIEDQVPNGKWDPGNYLSRRQSERIYQVSLTDLRANWVMEEVLNIEQIKAEEKSRTSDISPSVDKDIE